MNKYTKIRRIQKGQLGFQFGVTDTSNSTLTQTAQDAVNNQINQSTQGIRNQIYLRQFGNQLLNGYQQQSPSIYEGLTNFGIMSGNSTMANLGQLGNTINSGIQLAQNWNNLSVADRTTGVAGLTGLTMNTLDNMAFSKQHTNDSALTKGLNQGYDAIANTVMQFNPALGVSLYAGKFASDGLTSLGVGTDQMTTTDKMLDSYVGKLTPIGLVNGIWAKKTQDFSANDDTIEKVGSSYGGSVNTINDAVSKAGKKYGLFSSGDKKKANRIIDSARQQQNIMTNISNEYQDQLANKSDLAYTRYNMDINGGYQQQYVKAAKQGAILKRIQLRKHKEGGTLSNQLHSRINLETQEVEWKPVINLEISQETPKFKEGGELTNQFNNQEEPKQWQPNITINQSIKTMAKGGKSKESNSDTKQETNQKNIIPEGALHAHKHHMEHAEDLTKKGIPVVDNNGEQQAEVEKNEIIFSLEVTKQLEELHRKYQGKESTQKEKDEVAIEAGKLLVYEILHNTEDRTGLIKECKKGGILDEHK